MKQETKGLINWIKEQLKLNLSHLEVRPGEEGLNDIKNYKDLQKKAITFLDSLEVFENQLKHGGFIPDINNTPCKDGDLIKIVKPDRSEHHSPEFNEGEIYKLYWDFPNHKFSFMNTNTGDLYFFSCDDKFEKFEHDKLDSSFN